MKLGFIGLRGFTKDSNLIDMNGITLLTGKNSSGKSSFLKLFRLLFTAFSKINTLDDLFDIEVNIADDEFGGKEKISSLITEENPRIVFTTQFEFYRGTHEAHILLNVSDYAIRVRAIEFFDENGLLKKKPFAIWRYKGCCKFNMFYLSEMYREHVFYYNLSEKYNYAISEKNNENSFLEELLLDNEVEYLEDLLRSHIKPFDDKAVLGSHVNDFSEFAKDNIPFKVVEMKTNYRNGEEMVIFSESIASFELLRKEYDNFIREKKNLIEENGVYDDLEEFEIFVLEKKSQNSNFDEFKYIKKMYDYILKDYMVSTKDFKWDYVMTAVNLTFSEERKSNSFLHEFLGESSALESHIKEIIMGFSPYFDPLTIVAGEILNKTLIDQIRQLGNVKSLSNIRYQPTRSFNIYNASNAFSNFIKNWKVLDENTKKERLNFLKKYLVAFEIAEDILISIQDNIGFIHLIKNKQTFAIIDEGSGISNILSVALILSEALNIEENWGEYSVKSYDENEKFIILEEPESNLHPCLQSKLANLIVEIHRLTNVNIIIETHSEYLIRKLQYLVATDEIEPSKISINYFSLEKKRGKQFIQNKFISIDYQGILSDEFGSGFYDEANNLSIDLFLLNKTQKN